MRFSLFTALGAIAVAALAVQPASAGVPPEPGSTTATRAAAVRTIPLAESRRGALPVGELTPRSTAAFSLLGVSWDDPAQAPGQVEVRTRSTLTGRWSDWRPLAVGQDDRPDAASPESAGRGATTPLWVGPSDGVAVRAGSPGHPLPAGLRAELVDPGPSPARRTLADAGPRPGIVTRAGWGADESLREPGFKYTGPVRVVFVHHTDTSNDYACSDAPTVIRAIYQYHVKSNGWRDIGYNFLVDKCGTVYEGRAGGVAEPVLGAHTLGFNTDSAGVAALGTYVSTPVPAPQAEGIAAVAAWKLGLTGQDPKGTATLISSSDGSRFKAGTPATFNTVSGHRDAFNTQCPGDALYAQLPNLR